MDDQLEQMLDTLEIICEGACFAYRPYDAWPEIEKKLQELRSYLESKDITDPKRKCVDDTHHFKGCDCW